MNKGAYRRRCTWLMLALGASLAASVSADTLEERLRAQLRSTTQQLQALQSEQAQASAARQAAEQQRDAAQAQVRELTAQLASQQQAMHSQAQALVASSNEQLHKYKQAYEELLGMARGKEGERAALQAQLTERDGQVSQCQARNQQMYGVAKEMLAAYEKVDIADVVNMRQPFAGGARVRFEELAQAYGDRLYESQFDAPKGVNP